MKLTKIDNTNQINKKYDKNENNKKRKKKDKHRNYVSNFPIKNNKIYEEVLKSKNKDIKLKYKRKAKLFRKTVKAFGYHYEKPDLNRKNRKIQSTIQIHKKPNTKVIPKKPKKQFLTKKIKFNKLNKKNLNSKNNNPHIENSKTLKKNNEKPQTPINILDYEDVKVEIGEKVISKFYEGDINKNKEKQKENFFQIKEFDRKEIQPNQILFHENMQN